VWPSRLSRTDDAIGDTVFEQVADDNHSEGERYASASWRDTAIYGALVLGGTALVVLVILWVGELLLPR
jgi:hypothetical protein